MSKNKFKLRVIDHPLVRKNLTIIRDKKTSTENFREAIKRISIILAADISIEFETLQIIIETPLEKTSGHKLLQDVVLVPVLRAGLGMVNGFLELIPDAKVGHIGLQRNEETLEPVEYYYKTPKNIKNSIVILLDPMLATGGSASEAMKYLKQRSASKIIFACIVAAPEGVSKLQQDHPDVKIFAAVLDRKLNNKGYILPGLGDAGDRTFGTI